MVRSFRLILFSFVCCITSNVSTPAQFSPATIKQEVESSSSYSYYYGSYKKTTNDIAQDVLTDTTLLKKLLATYPIEDMVGWNNGANFLYYLKSYADDNAKAIIAPHLKIYIQKQLSVVWDNGIQALSTPTTMHALNDPENTGAILQDFNQSYKQQLKQIAPLLCSIVKEEKELYDKGYFVFFHGQRWEYLFGEKLYTDLWALTKGKNRPDNYLFPHVRVAGLDPEANGKLDRKRLINKDDWNYYAYLFTTNSLFCNYQSSSYSSPLSYFLRNNNCGNVRFSLYDIFVHYNLTHLYTKYQQEITDLENHFNAARTFGTILRVAVPKNMVNEYCFGQDYAAKTDTRAALEKLWKQTGTMGYEAFCIVMLDEAMNPEGRLLIKPYHCAESTEWKNFETGYETLIQKLAAEINKPAKNGKNKKK